MCTAINYRKKFNYFGRNLDYEHSFGEKITITPRNYEFNFRNYEKCESHYAIIGMAAVVDNYPLYFDATNEKGLSMAGLSFPHFAEYMAKQGDKVNVASFEFIPWILARCDSLSSAREELKNINITKESFNTELETTPLHWIIADKTGALTVEQTAKGLVVYENNAEVLTNSPDFGKQMFNLNNYLSLSAKEPVNSFANSLGLNAYSRGMGAIGLPGDFSSMSRFVKACFVKHNSVCGDNETEAVNQFFHILYSVYQIRGCSFSEKGSEITHYTSCCNTNKCIYYYTTYNNSSINAVDMYKENLNQSNLITFNIVRSKSFHMQN